VQGICAQMDLWRTSANYRNKRFADAIAIWSGHNSVESYISFVIARAPGMTRDTVMDDAFWRGPLAIPFLKAQAWHEAGKQYPAAESDWIDAQKRVLSGVPTPNTVKKAAGSTATVVPTTVALHQAGFSPLVALAVGCAVALAVFLIWKFKPQSAATKAEQDTPHPEILADAAALEQTK
jgi:hypothetical protein